MQRWWATGLLTVQNSLRFCTNIGMYILLNYWAYTRIPNDPNAAANLAGNLTAATTIGMGVGALAAGRFVRPGTERVTFALTAIAGAGCVALINVAGEWGLDTFDGGFEMLPAYAAVLLAAVGYFGIVPGSIGLEPRGSGVEPVDGGGLDDRRFIATDLVGAAGRVEPVRGAQAERVGLQPGVYRLRPAADRVGVPGAPHAAPGDP